MPLSNIPSDLTSNLTVVYTPLPHINSKTIECNSAALADWLNDMADRVNDHSYRIIQLINAVQELANAVMCLEEMLGPLGERITELENWRVTANERMDSLQSLINSINTAINTINNELASLTNTVNNNHGPRIVNLETDMTWFNERLPRSKTGMPESYKLAMGNINVMSAGGGTPSLDIGIFTSGAIENNDLHFN